jgi:hypothetical protein
MHPITTQDLRQFADKRVTEMKARADLYLARARRDGNNPKAQEFPKLLLGMIDEACGFTLLADLAHERGDTATRDHISTQLVQLSLHLLTCADEAHAACTAHCAEKLVPNAEELAQVKDFLASQPDRFRAPFHRATALHLHLVPTGSAA